jgi:hypothetical protein
MKPLKKYTLILFSILSFVFVGNSFAKEIYVSNTNTATGDGSLLNPYHTIQQAADVAVSGDIIFIRAGVYREEVKMVSDGVTYQSYPGETVVINGTEQLKNWLPVPGGTVYQTTMNFDAPNNRIQFPTNQLFVDQKMIELVRWPNQTSSNISIPSNALADDATSNNPGPNGNGSSRGTLGILKDANFNEPDGRWVGASIWINLSNGNLDGQGTTCKVVATNRAAHTITYDFGQKVLLGNQPWTIRAGTEYYLFNPTKAGIEATGGINAILDPGEWVKLDSTVYVNMPNGLAPSSLNLGNNIVEAKKREFAFSLKSSTDNLSYYTIKDLKLFASTITTDTRYLQDFKSVKEDANFITIDGINAKYLSHFTLIEGFGTDGFYGRSGIILSGRNCVIKNCNIEYSGSQGISILGQGNKALNNVIKSVNYMVTNAGAIATGSICVDCEIGYNTISNTSLMAINFSGFTNSDGRKKGIARIHHNKLYDFMLRSNDSGGINDVGTFGNWARIDHNEMYKTFNTTRSEQDVYGLYFDYNRGSYLVDHNLIYSMKQAMLINRVANMSIYNNTFLSNTATEQGIVDATGGSGLSDTIRNNILSGAAGQPCCTFFNLSQAVTDHNIVNAFGNVQTQLFVNPSAGNFQLQPTATSAIDKGVNYYQFNDPIVGSAVDLGAFEYGGTPFQTGPTTILPPTIIPTSGEFIDKAPINFKTDATGPNVTIRYTLNGSDPTISSPLYANQPVIITDSTWIKARVFVNDLPSSEVSSANVWVTKIANIPPISAGISKPSGTYPVIVYVSLYSPNPEVKEIRYTLDGSEPTVNSLLYKGLLFIDKPTTVKAIAIGKYIVSPVVTAVYDITGPTVDININGGNITQPTNITLSANPYSGSTIYYTLDGTNPTTSSTLYTAPLTISSATTLKYLAINNGLVGDVKTAVFTADNIKDVVFSPNGGTFKDTDVVTATLTSSTVGASIYYTTDGSTPTINSTLYNGQTIAIPTSVTIKALVVANGIFGNITSASFTVAGPDVTFSPDGGTFNDVTPVTLSSVAGASIYYTTNGTNPTAASTLYTAPVLINSLSTTVNAIAIRNGNIGSLKSATYTINKPLLTFTPDGITSSREITASITSSIPDAIIYYTIDGSTPTKTSSVYISPIQIKQTSTIKAIAIKGLLQSDIKVSSFTITLGEAKVNVFPNPTSGGQFFVDFNHPQQGQIIRVFVYDVLGKLVYSKLVTMTDSVLQEEAFDSHNLKPGTYIIKMKTVSAQLTDLLDEEVKLVVK